MEMNTANLDYIHTYVTYADNKGRRWRKRSRAESSGAEPVASDDASGMTDSPVAPHGD